MILAEYLIFSFQQISFAGKYPGEESVELVFKRDCLNFVKPIPTVDMEKEHALARKTECHI
jgi:hypothetical protein